MARQISRSIQYKHHQATALVGVLSLSLLPVAVQAQIRTPGTPPSTPQPMVMRPGGLGSPMPSFAPPPFLMHPGLPSPSLGSVGGSFGGVRTFERPPMPGYGGMNGGVLNGGSLFNRNGVDFNSLFQRMPNGVNGYGPYGPQFPPYQQGNPNLFNYGQANQGNLNPPPATRPAQRYYSTRSQQPNINVGSSYDRYSHSTEGHAYRYDQTHHLHHLAGAGWDIYFPYGASYYPYYYSDYAYGLTAPSLYYYYGTFPPYIGANYVYQEPPQYVYVPYPVYTPDGQYNGDRADDVDNYYLNQNQKPDAAPSQKQDNNQGNYKVGESATKQDALLDSAVSDLSTAWKNGDIQTLSKHIRRDARVAVYLRGKYQYSLDASDYLDMTRDAFRATKTVSFTLDKVQRKEKGVYTVSGHHTYTDQKGKRHTILVSYVLEKVDDEYYLTQVGTAPEKLEE